MRYLQYTPNSEKRTFLCKRNDRVNILGFDNRITRHWRPIARLFPQRAIQNALVFQWIDRITDRTWRYQVQPYMKTIHER